MVRVQKQWREFGVIVSELTIKCAHLPSKGEMMDHRSLNCIGRISSQQQRNEADVTDTTSSKRRPHSWHSSTQTLCRVGMYPCGAHPHHTLLHISFVLFSKRSPQKQFSRITPLPCTAVPSSFVRTRLH